MEVPRTFPAGCPRGTYLCFIALGAVLLFALYLLQFSSANNSALLLFFSSPPNSSPSLHAEIAELRKEQQSHQAQMRALRALLGALSCKVQGVGPTGGFCLSVESPGESPGLNKVDEGYAKVLGELFAGQSVLDVGTGLGNYGRWFKEHAPTVAWTGVDGAENIEEVTGGWVKFADFTEELRLPKADWVMSIEVGEHLPKQFEDVFVDNLCGLAKAGVVVTWARPGQLGYAHVNEKSFEDVKQMFVSRGMSPDEGTGQRLREVAGVPWLETNTQVFRWERT